MFAAVFQWDETLRLVELIVSVGIPDAPKSVALELVIHQVEAVKGMERTMRSTDHLAIGSLGQWKCLHLVF
jgi:hypothetical protein